MTTVAQQRLQDLRKRLQQSLANGKQHLGNAGNSAKQHLSNAGKNAKNGVNKLILYIPKDYQGDGNGLNDLVREAEALGIEIHRSEKNSTDLAKEVFGTTEKLLGFTERGFALFAPQLDKLLQKSPKLGNTNSQSIGGNLGKAQSVLSTLQSFLGIASASIGINELSKQEDVSKNELAKSSIDLLNEIVNSVSSVAQNIDNFGERISKIGNSLQQIKGLSGVGNKLQNLPNLSNAGYGLDALSGILSAISASFILGNEDATEETKAAAGVELTAQILGNISKAASQYVLAQRAAAGLSTTGPVVGLIASVVSLAISPLSFLGVADKFKRASMLRQFAERFQKFGYDGDSLLAEFHEKSGAIDASITTISTALNAISAGVGAASAGSLVGAPVGLLVSGITGLIMGILEASKQAIFENVANRLADKISEWEKKHGKNYFENGYDARYQAKLEDSLAMLSNFSKQYNVDQVVAITQQHWDEHIGELAGITRNGHRVQSGKVYSNAYRDGKILENLKNRFEKQTIDPLKGTIDLRWANSSTYLDFLTPLLPPGEEIRNRKQTGKYAYVTELIVNRVDRWTVYLPDVDTTANFANLIQHVRLGSNVWRSELLEAKLILKGGRGDDKIFLSSGSAEVDGGEGHDVVYYDKTPEKDSTGTTLYFDGRDATEAGSYKVKRDLGNAHLLQEVTKTQEVSVGKRTESIQYRDYELVQNPLSGIEANDTLKSIEEIVGSYHQDEFYGSKFTDIFHGGNGDDYILGEAGDDKLFGDAGDDRIFGGEGNDQIWGGEGNDKIIAGTKGNKIVDGGDGDDEIDGSSSGNDQLRGGKGNDRIGAGDGNNLLDGGEGNDDITGGSGDDIYLFRKSYGHHQIRDRGGNDKLSLADLSLSDLTFRKEDTNLKINVKGSNGSITVKDWFHQLSGRTNSVLEEIIDKDHKVITSQEINKQMLVGTNLSLIQQHNSGVGSVHKLVSATAAFATTQDYGIASPMNSLLDNNGVRNYAMSLTATAA